VRVYSAHIGMIMHSIRENALEPALLYSISSVPPVRLEISALTAAMLS
jgi:hypothetical protein